MRAIVLVIFRGTLIIIICLVIKLMLESRLKPQQNAVSESTTSSQAVGLTIRDTDALQLLAQKIATRLTANWEMAMPFERQSMAEQFCSELDANSVEKTLLYLNLLAPEALRPELIRALFLHLTALDPAKASALADNLLHTENIGTEEIAEVQLAIVKEWFQRDLLGTEKWVESWPDEPGKVPAVMWLIPFLEKTNPLVAGRLVLSLPDGLAKTDALNGLVATWAARDFNEALTWAKELTGNESQDMVLLRLSRRWWQTDPNAAWKFAQNLPEGQDRLAITLASYAMENNPKATAVWAANLSDGSRKDRIITSLTAMWAENEPQAAAEYVVGLPISPMRDEAVISVVSAWAAQDPAKVANWVTEFPEGQTREYAIENVAIRWAATDPTAAAKWLDNELTGRDRDMAIRAGATGLIESHPEIAVEWMAAIQNRPMRDNQMERVASLWLETEPELARRWIAQSDLSSKTKEALIGGH